MVTKTENTAALPLSKVAEVLDALAAATGERDPEKLLDMVKAALQTPMAPVDMAADPEMAAVLAKAAEYSASTGGVPRAHLAMARSDVEAITYAKGIKPTRIGPDATAREHADRRGDLTALRDRAKAQGNVEGAAMWQRELDVAEARAATQTPSATIGWGGVARPLTAA